ncbi:MAG: L-aspartate oxidase [Planctomycetota bacterium]|jgi:L-aspartate oxidase|nr:L-aspartate oxidase [Planctomycetota bacterium]
MTFSQTTRRYLVSCQLNRLWRREIPLLVIGSGVAGLRAAIEAAEEVDVLVVTKGKVHQSNTRWAQGGIATVLDQEDSLEAHVADTRQVGAGLVDLSVARKVVAGGPSALEDLLGWGANFDAEEEGLALTREGGHSFRRVIHSGGDATGLEVQRTLVEKARQSPRIHILEDVFVIDLVTDMEGGCCGALVWERPGRTSWIQSRTTILAAGGAGRMYRETTNPEEATGDGQAMAWRAGVTMADLEFVQFHPTTLYVPGSQRKLITEAVRGEGAYLRDRNGERFLVPVHPDAELAPRDVVSRAILSSMAECGDTHVRLDIRHLDVDQVLNRFPGLARIAEDFRFDLTREMVPVRPSAHYFIGGIRTDLQCRSDVPGLYGCGEVTASGLHGGNRLGSNSLLEGLVLGKEAGAIARKDLRVRKAIPPREMKGEEIRGGSGPHLDLMDLRNSLESLLDRRVGVFRDRLGLEEARERIGAWSRYVHSQVFQNPEGWEMQNLLTLAGLVVEQAIAREESRGVHHREDFPNRDDERFGRRLFVRREA